MIRAFFTLLFLLATPVAAQDRLPSYDGVTALNGVGRLAFSDGGFCTASVVRDRMVLTAAHCLFRDGTAIALDDLTFQSGFRNGLAIETRRIVQAVAHPMFTTGETNRPPEVIAHDIAVLMLDSPVDTLRIRPFQIAAQLLTGETVRVVSYGEHRAETPLSEEGCLVLGRQEGVVVLNCDAEFGSSGAPVMRFEQGEWRIASVISATAKLNGGRVSLGTSLESPLRDVLMILGDMQERDSRSIFVGQRAGSGAKFVQP